MSWPEPVSVGPCPSCGGDPAWERLVDRGQERWLSTCERCGRWDAFLPDVPGRVSVDPLADFLAGPGAPPRPQTPPWTRLFLRSLEGRDPAVWRWEPAPCSGCGSRARFSTGALTAGGSTAACALCLACGRTVSGQVPAAGGPALPPLVGDAWAPPCPAVQRLREAVAYWRPARRRRRPRGAA